MKVSYIIISIILISFLALIYNSYEGSVPSSKYKISNDLINHIEYKDKGINLLNIRVDRSGEIMPGFEDNNKMVIFDKRGTDAWYKIVKRDSGVVIMLFRREGFILKSTKMIDSKTVFFK